KAVRGAWFPQLTLTLGPSFAGKDITALTTNFQVSLALGYSAGGLNPLLVHGQRREARANEAVALEQARASRNAVRLETAQSAATLRAAREAVRAARSLEAAATQRRELANGRFEAGLGTVLELSDAESQYVNARAQRIQAVYDLDLARA